MFVYVWIAVQLNECVYVLLSWRGKLVHEGLGYCGYRMNMPGDLWRIAWTAHN